MADRADEATLALEFYERGHTLVEVAKLLGCSYGKAHALVKEAGGTPRRRGARAR